MSSTTVKPTASTRSATRQMIGFHLGPERFAIDISKIHEIIKPLPITGVPNIPSGFSGVIELRDQVIVIADLHGRFGFATPEHGKDTRIVVLEGAVRRIGILVDAVSEVVRFTPAMIDPSPGFHNGSSVDYIDGMGRMNGELLTILNVEVLFPDSIETESIVVDEETPELVIATPSAVAVPETTTHETDPADMNIEPDTDLYRNLGELARYINSAHESFAKHAGNNDSINIKAKDLPSAYELLARVTEETESATMKVMGHTEETSGTIGELRNLIDEVEDLIPASSEGKAKISDITDRMRNELSSIENIQGETIMAMSFQDLTGQKIKQVVALMADVEERILRLVVEFGIDQAKATEEVVEEKLQTVKEMSQDSVNDLLSEFGF